MNHLKKQLLAFVAIAMAVFFAGCIDPVPDPVITIKHDPYISVTASAGLSRDLLRFVSPVLTISGNNRTQSFELMPNGLHQKLSDTLSFRLSPDSIYVDMRFKKEQSVKGSVLLEFKTIDNVAMTKEEYEFSVAFDSRYLIFNGKEITSSDVMGRFELSDKVNREDVEAYITEHLSTPIKIDLDIK